MEKNQERLELFKQLRAEIRGSKKSLVVGIDVAKETHYAFFGTPAGKVLRKKFKFSNNKQGLESLTALARDLQLQNGLSKVVYGLEPTGVYHKPLLEYLIREDETAVLVSNVASQRNRELLDGRWDKNDVGDAANVADLIGQGRCLFAYDPEIVLRTLDNFVRSRIQLKKQEHALRMRIRNRIIAQFFPELECAYSPGGQDMVVLAIVRKCLNPREIAKMTFDEFWNLVAEPHWGKRQEDRVMAAWQGARETIGCTMDEAIAWQAPHLVNSLENLRADIADLEGKMRQTSRQLPWYSSVISIPGIGPILASMLLTAIGDPNRFKHSRQVIRMAGLDLCASRSGKSSDRAVPKISKQGKPALRYALVQASIIATRSNPTIRAYFSKRLKGREQERGIKLKMHCKLAAKLLVVAWTLMKRNDTFKAEHFMN